MTLLNELIQRQRAFRELIIRTDADANTAALAPFFASLPDDIRQVGYHDGHGFIDVEFVLVRPNVHFTVRFFPAQGTASVGSRGRDYTDGGFWQDERILDGIHNQIVREYALQGGVDLEREID